jgi:hypothetical protein
MGLSNTGDADDNPFHMDHVIPLWAKGDDLESNIVKACESCNMEKGPDLWQPILGALTASGQPFINWSYYAEKRRGWKVLGRSVKIVTHEHMIYLGENEGHLNNQRKFRHRLGEWWHDPDLVRWHTDEEIREFIRGY